MPVRHSETVKPTSKRNNFIHFRFFRFSFSAAGEDRTNSEDRTYVEQQYIDPAAVYEVGALATVRPHVGSMAMVSPKLRGDMARRTRAVSARKPASGLISAKPPSRSSSLPAPSRPKMHDLDNTISAPRTRDDDGAINHTEVLSDVITPPTKISRIARSGSGSERSVPPTSSVVRFRLDIDNDEEHLRSTASSAPSQGQRADDKIIRVLGEENLRPSLKKMSAVPATPAATGAQKTARKNVDKEDRTSHSSKAAGDEDRTGDQNQEEEEISGDSLSGGVGVEAHSPESSPRQGLKSTEEENIAFCRDTSGGPALDLGIPGKLMELMEDRDKAVHLCLQVRGDVFWGWILMRFFCPDGHWSICVLLLCVAVFSLRVQIRISILMCCVLHTTTDSGSRDGFEIKSNKLKLSTLTFTHFHSYWVSI